MLDKDSLVTEAGRRVDVIYPGRRNNDSGPDFCNAIIMVDGHTMLRGDIELHVRAADWRTHGHHRNPNYNSVILHVVMWNERSGSLQQVESGDYADTIALCGHLQIPPEVLCLSTHSSPYSQGLCNDVLARLGDKGVTNALDEAGEQRFIEKARAFREGSPGEEAGQVLYEGFMRALGYAKNTQPFEALARRLRLDIVEGMGWGKSDEECVAVLQAMLFGTAGLLPTQRNIRADAWVSRLEGLWDRFDHRGAKIDGHWRLFRVRPENSPARRIAAASSLIVRYRDKGLFQGMLNLVRQACADNTCAGLRQGIAVTTKEYWASHVDLGIESTWNPTLLGRWRADDIIVNVLLPFFFAWAESESRMSLQEDILQLYRHYPRLENNWITRHMEQQIFGQCYRRLVNSAQRQQGLIHLYRTFCIERKCAQCQVGGA